MADVFEPAKRSEVMSQIRSKDTKPELMVRRFLHSVGYRYSLHRVDLPGKPDIVMPGRRTIIQVRGCFWHGHGCWLAHRPDTRRDYWDPKIAATRKRDARNDRKLRDAGWRVITVWECKCRKASDFEKEMARVEVLIRALA